LNTSNFYCPLLPMWCDCLGIDVCGKRQPIHPAPLASWRGSILSLCLLILDNIYTANAIQLANGFGIRNQDHACSIFLCIRILLGAVQITNGMCCPYWPGSGPWIGSPAITFRWKGRIFWFPPFPLLQYLLAFRLSIFLTGVMLDRRRSGAKLNHFKLPCTTVNELGVAP
jgi:hypothetical protein